MGKFGATKRGCARIGRGAPHWVKRKGRRYKKCGKKLKRSRRHRMNLVSPMGSSIGF